METRLHAQPKAAPPSFFTPVAGGVLRRKCACGGSAGLAGDCEACDLKKLSLQRATQNSELGIRNFGDVPPIVHDVLRSSGQPLDAETRAFMEPRFGHDFSKIQIRSQVPSVANSAAQRSSSNGSFAIASTQGHKVFSLNGPDAGSPSQPGSPTPAQPQPRRSNCPTDIAVVGVGQGTDVDFGKTGPITGWGAFARMEVSDPGGSDWHGTAIHENLRNIKNTCGPEGNKACSNASGEGGGGPGSFKVGSGSNFLGLAELPAVKNRFYDTHAFVDKGSSLLHMLDPPKQNCEVECEQFYDCGGRRFGPDFLITYLMTSDSVPRTGGGFNAVTRVEVRKAAKSAPTAQPAP